LLIFYWKIFNVLENLNLISRGQIAKVLNGVSNTVNWYFFSWLICSASKCISIVWNWSVSEIAIDGSWDVSWVLNSTNNAYYISLLIFWELRNSVNYLLLSVIRKSWDVISCWKNCFSLISWKLCNCILDSLWCLFWRKFWLLHIWGYIRVISCWFLCNVRIIWSCSWDNI